MLMDLRKTTVTAEHDRIQLITICEVLSKRVCSVVASLTGEVDA